MRCHMRWMIRRDMPAVLEMEQSQSDSWAEEEILRVLRERNCIGMVCEHGDRVLGYILYELRKHHLEVLRLLVHPGYRRRGAGRTILAKLTGKLSRHRRTFLAVNVPDSELGTHLFLKASGLLAIRVLREHGAADAYRFVYYLPELLDADSDLLYAADHGGEG